MKRLLTLLAAVAMLLTLCSCEIPAFIENNIPGFGSTNTVTNNDSETKKTYPGVWTHEKTDADPYYFTITLLEDGTGTMGRNGKTKLTWNENDDGSITINLDYGDGSTFSESKAQLLEDGALRWHNEFTISTVDGNNIKIESLILTKS
jgi:hypothetical protein